jgi:hypothetical protein
MFFSPVKLQLSLALERIIVSSGRVQVCESEVGEASVFGFEILPPSSERLRAPKLVGALHADGFQCTLSVIREVEMQIPYYDSDHSGQSGL